MSDTIHNTLASSAGLCRLVNGKGAGDKPPVKSNNPVPERDRAFLMQPPQAEIVLFRARFEGYTDALRYVAETEGDGAYEEISFCFYKDEAALIKTWIAKHGRQKLQERLLCLIAEAK